jgi:hypothetical protein
LLHLKHLPNPYSIVLHLYGCPIPYSRGDARYGHPSH